MPREELLSGRGTSARQTAYFISRIEIRGGVQNLLSNCHGRRGRKLANPKSELYRFHSRLRSPYTQESDTSPSTMQFSRSVPSCSI
jgi:hypothetical protein